MNTENAMLRAANLVGGQAELARRIGKSPGFVNQMVKGVRPIPATLCLAVERATDGGVTRLELRPDVFDDSVA